MKFSFLLLISIFSFPIFSQSCLPNGITFSNQQSIDNFPVNYPGCTTIEGNVFMHGAINNLDGLSQITNIQGRLTIADNPNLVSLGGLHNLTHIGSDLQLQGNGTVDFSGLENLTSIGGNLIIYTHLHLINLSGLDNLTSIGKSIDIELNTQLTSLSGLENIGNFGQNLTLLDNNKLSDLSALSQITSIFGYIKIGRNPKLNNFAGLDNLTSVDGYLSIFENNLLSNLSALDHLTNINGYLFLDGNLLLNDITGLENINPASIQSNNINRQDLEIHNNPTLSECAIDNICTLLADPNKTKNIHDNQTNCNSLQEVGQICMPLPCAILQSPPSNATNVPINTSLSWNAIEGANGYQLSIGTTSGSGNIMNHVDIGAVTDFQPNTIPCGQDIYVTITPYNNEGDAIGCPESHFITENIIANAGADAHICIGASFQINAQGGSTFQWSLNTSLNNTNIANPIANPDTTTTYIVTVSNDGRCPDTDSITIIVDTPPNANITSTDESTNNGNDGEATANPSDGIPPYLYQWSNGATTPLITNLSPNTYSLTLEDANGCSSIDSVVIHPFVCPKMTIHATQEDVSCYDACNGSLHIEQVAQATPPLIFNWNTGDTTNFISDICAGQYAIIITDKKNCTITQNYEIAQPSLLLNHLSSTDETAYEYNDGTATAAASGGTPPYFYSWSNGANISEINGLSPGMYVLTLTDNNDCQREDTVFITAFSCQNIIIHSTQINSSCNGICDGSINITSVENATPPLSYVWSNGHTTAGILALCPGDYTVTITDHNNCSSTQSYHISQPAPLLNTLLVSHETANESNDGIINATPSGGTLPYFYSWSNGANIPTISGLYPGLYILTTTDNNGCHRQDTAIINAFECPEMTIHSINEDSSCFGNCDGSISVSGINGAIPPIAYQWSNTDTTQSISNLCAGAYTLTITDDKNCSNTQNFTLTEPSEIIANIDSTDNITANHNGGIYISTNNSENFSFSWVGPNGFSANTEDIENLLEDGCYTLSITNTTTLCTKEITACIELISSTKDQLPEEVILSPNPSKNYLNINFGNQHPYKALIELFDRNGKKILEAPKSKNTPFVELNLTPFPSGLYIIKITTAKFECHYKKILHCE